ncbi:hypothetical protein [Kribbella sp. CA-293567]|uniref:hypothetical protein n=1 Tax=Kribbella sp. CA-293567 TaxID=3002436 RepID=UPI0022DCF845|nr:hypothetical protein [Kribbella sp. CA-293567]WBQ07817.1 hypothetical protein OX958_13695 [Kribbella sp. CA-293567]
MIPVFSYPTLFGDVDLEVMSVSVDGSDLPYAQISKLERTVALDHGGRSDWESATLRLRATLPDDEASGGPWSELTCLSVLTEKATNSRSSSRLSVEADGHWHGAIELVRGSHLTRATLSLAVVATVGGVAGRLIGQTRENWYVDLVATVPKRQRAIDIMEADFANGPEEWLRPFKESPWIVDTTGDTPTVYLNTGGVEGLLEILNGTGGAATEKMVRETTAAQIAHDAWTAMFHTAVADLDFDEDGTPQMPTGWKARVLRLMIPDVLPGRQLNDALYEINDRRTKGFGWSGLQTSIQYAAGRRSRLNRTLTNAARIALRGEGDEAR